jgi:outer membrane protein assembly factor BamB
LRTPLADGTYPYTYGLAIDGNGSVFVADVGGVQKLSSDGSQTTIWNADTTHRVESIAVDPQGTVVALIYGYQPPRMDMQIVRLSPGGQQVAHWAVRGAPTRMTTPFQGDKNMTLDPNAHTEIAIDAQGRVYVPTAGPHADDGRVIVFSPDGGELLSFDLPNPVSGLAVDSDGSIWASFAEQHEVRKFSSSGGLLGRWSNWLGPGDLAIANGHVYVVDLQGGGTISAVGP